ncbi:hypothetical protein C0584_02180 [Candidatus Parcubacteria bacterium]|nr:MAG: hypothetical protein C0584_02180 [Candidatus Parcubacteria bacterium]
MFETSTDILNIVKAISIFSLAAILTWAIYYFAMIFREIFKIVKETRGLFKKIEEMVDMIKEKIEHSTSYLLLMSEGVKKLVEVIGNYTSKKEKKSSEDEGGEKQ